MEAHDYSEALGLSARDYEAALDRFETRRYEGTEYRNLPDYDTRLERGTVLYDGAVVRGFPKVARTLMLSEGVPRYFDGEVHVEEKMDGYNVRLARPDGELLAFTRSGIVCPFTTMWVRRRYGDVVGRLLDERGREMVCVEMVGPDNPYTSHDYDEVDSLDLRVFDLRDSTTGRPVPVEERRSACDEHGLPQVEYLGAFDSEEAAGCVVDLVVELDERGREGVVMKSPDVSQQLKYTTSAANLGDLEFAFSLPFDYGQAFVFRRLLREAFRSYEFEYRDVSERAREVGESILLPMVDVIERVSDGEVVGERHSVRATHEEVDALLAHLEDVGMHLVVERDEAEGEERVVEFVKKTQATQDKTELYLGGHVVRE